MKYNIKLYTTFDADLLSLNAAGISVTGLIALALKYRARGKRARFLIRGCPKYELRGRRRLLYLTVNVTDSVSVAFLNREIKRGQRSAFFKSIVREALVSQAVGAYFRNEETIRKEAAYAMGRDVSGFENLFVFTPGKRKRDYTKEILYGEMIPDEPCEEEAGGDDNGRKKNRFGDVSDLSLSAQMERKKGKDKTGGDDSPEKQDAPVPGRPAAQEEPVPEETPSADEDNQEVSEQDLMNLFIDM